MSACIIGAGIAGLLLILSLDTINRVDNLYIIDPHFDGGDLARKWTNVLSNTPWSVTLNSIKQYLPNLVIPQWAYKLPLDQPTPVYIIAKLIRELAAPILRRVNCVQGFVESAAWNSTTSEWTIRIKNVLTVISVKRMYLTYGAQEKSLDISIPSIPLEIALDSARLSKYIQPTDKVVVFGTRHSGTIILKNLVDCSANSVIAIHNGTAPFIWARDGEYEGLKLESAIIADNIIKGLYKNVECISTSNISALIRETRSANWVIYAIGFRPHGEIIFTVDSVSPSSMKYDTTGKLLECPSTWGFGFAYPNQAPDGIHWDVGVSSFLEHISKQPLS